MEEVTQSLFLWVVGIIGAILIGFFFNSDSVDNGTKKVIGIILIIVLIVGTLLYGGD